MYQFDAICTYVVDGDTVDLTIDVGFKLITTQRVRLIGIDTPERGQKGYQEAKDFVASKVLNRAVVVHTYKSDDFGRYLANITVDGVNLSNLLLDQGLAVPYVK